MTTTSLLQQSGSDVRQILKDTEKLLKLDQKSLSFKTTSDSWSVAQCLQHLNAYSRYYLPAIESGLDRYEGNSSTLFSSGLLGGYFTKLMKTDSSGKVKVKMKSPKNATPELNPESKIELEEFISHQHKLLELIHRSEKSNLTKIKIPISIMPFIKMRLGDTFGFFIEHEKRHFKQIERVLESIHN